MEQHVLGEGESAYGAIRRGRDIEERVVLSHGISVTNQREQNVCNDEFDDGSGHTVTVNINNAACAAVNFTTNAGNTILRISSGNNLTVGGKFTSTMAAKDGSFSFDFSGIYTEVKPNEIINYTMDDGRIARILFASIENQIKIAKLVNSIPVEEMESAELREKINSYIKEIDTIIAYLSE